MSGIRLALGCGVRHLCDVEKLRYERIIIMTDADVDGAHIAALLMTLFYREMPELSEAGRLYLARPPLYRLSQGSQTAYARDDKHKDELLKKQFKGRGKVEISRFKGLGEMPARQLKETTMDKAKRTLLRVTLTDAKAATEPTESTMPKTSASSGSSRPAGSGRFMVLSMWRSMSRSYHILMAPAAPAPMAMQTTAKTPLKGSMPPGASKSPTRAVKTTSDITLGFNSTA